MTQCAVRARRGATSTCSSRLPEPRLLDAAHIVMDVDEQRGQPIVTNGLPPSKIHHAAFDANLSGSTRISASMYLTGCSISTTGRSSDKGSKDSWSIDRSAPED